MGTRLEGTGVACCGVASRQSLAKGRDELDEALIVLRAHVGEFSEDVYSGGTGLFEIPH